MSTVGKVLLLGAPPLTGKSTMLESLRNALGVTTGERWLTLDNEDVFTMGMRVLCSEASGVDLAAPEFKRFNREGQLAYQRLARKLALQGCNVVMPGPFEDLSPLVEGKPLLHLMQEQFAPVELIARYVLLWPAGDEPLDAGSILTSPAMVPVEEEIQRRRLQRSDGEGPQAKLDADKQSSDYYRQRAARVLRSALALNIPVIQARIGEAPALIARRVADSL